MTGIKRARNIWNLMKHRCNVPKDKDYFRYGGRGIKVCKEWESFDVFWNWALCNGYSDSLQIDRTDNNRGYSPENCRWTDIKTQANNRRGSVYITYGGVTQTLSEWAERGGMSCQMLWRRLYISNWSIEKSITAPIGKRRYLYYNGELKRLNEWAKLYNLDYDTLESRINCHKWSIERALTTP